jgi:hypothetical protein
MCYHMPMPDGLPTPEQPKIEAPAAAQEAGIDARAAHEQTSVEADEAVRETLAETQDSILHAESKPELESAMEMPAPVGTGTAPQAPKDEVTIEVEKVLEDGIGPFYASLPEDAKPLFKKKGEEAAREISTMVRTLHVQVKRVLQLITQWLKTIPGVNTFFLEQESKIKTDRIMALADERKKETTQQ